MSLLRSEAIHIVGCAAMLRYVQGPSCSRRRAEMSTDEGEKREGMLYT